MLFDERNRTQQVSQHRHTEDPADSAEHVEGDEADVVHFADSGDKGREGADNRDKTRIDDRLPAVFFIEGPGALQMFAVEKPRVRTAEDFGPRAPPERVSE